KPASLRPVFGLPCQTANLWRIKILAQWCRSRHDEPPGFAMLNLTRLHLGIAHESQFQGLGISAAMLRGATLIAWLVVPVPALAQDNIVATATLPRDLSPWGMYLNADPVVKAVLIGLAAASIVTWTVWLAKTIEIFFAKRRVRTALTKLVHVRSTAEGAERLADSRGVVIQFLDASVTELKVSAGSTHREGVKDRIASRLERIEASYGATDLTRHRRACHRCLNTTRHSTGDRILVGILPKAAAAPVARLEPYGLAILIGLLIVLPLVGAQLGIDLDVVSRALAISTGAIIEVILHITGNI